MLRALPIFLALGSVLFACGGDDTPFVTNGSNDLRKACDLRAEWSQFKTVECQQCIATAPLATCNCTVSAPYVGKCAQQLAFKRASPDCDDALERCVGSCAQGACGCVETCYSSRADCKVRAAALDGCVTEVCSAVCR